MKTPVCLCVALGLLTAVLAQGLPVQPGNGLLPMLPLRFSAARRFDPRYVDSVLTHTRLSLRRIESIPRSHSTDTLRLELLVHLSYVYQFTAGVRQDSVQLVARQLIQLAQQWGDVRFQVRGLVQSDYYFYTLKADYPQALQANYEALRLLETSPPVADRYLWRIQKNLGRLSYRMGKYGESIQFFQTATSSLSRDRWSRVPVEQIHLLQLLSESYKFMHQLDSAEHCSVKALNLARHHIPAPISLAYLHGDLAVIYLHQRRYNESLAQLELAEGYWQQAGRQNGLAVTWADMAHIYYLTHQYDQALDYARRALATDTGIPSTRLLIYEMLALASSAKSEWQPAFTFHQRFKAVADSIQRGHKIAETMALQANFEREKLVLSQRQAQLLQEQRYLTLQREKQLQQQQFLTLAKETELQQLQATTEQQRLRQMARQTDLQRRLETQALKAQAETRHNQQQSQIKTLHLNDLQTRLTLQERTRNFGLALAGLIGLSLMGYTQLLRRKNKALRRANDDIKAALLHGQTQEMTALRAQMNPHFIFNCLNSIKLYATENDSEKASDYLTKFSRLIRMVLENSRSDRTPLRNELDMLQLYADMEIMRFKQKLAFFVEVDPSIDTRFVEIPPLLIQPYVENAIWHGLMHKPEGGTVYVRVSQPQENRLQLVITDDGVGRVRAAELKSKSASHHKSFGLKMTSERIALVNQLYQTNTQVLIEDLVDADGQPAGTEVILQIPV